MQLEGPIKEEKHLRLTMVKKKNATNICEEKYVENLYHL